MFISVKSVISRQRLSRVNNNLYIYNNNHSIEVSTNIKSILQQLYSNKKYYCILQQRQQVQQQQQYWKKKQQQVQKQIQKMRGFDLLTTTTSVRWLICGIICNDSISRTNSLVFGSKSTNCVFNPNNIDDITTTPSHQQCSISSIPFLHQSRNSRPLSTTTRALSSSSSASSSSSNPTTDDTVFKSSSSSLHASVSSVESEQVSSMLSTESNSEMSDSSSNDGDGDGDDDNGVIILAKETDFSKPDRDPRQYRAIRLSNNLEVLLVSDQMTTGIGIEAASVHVQAGHFDDTIPGLAHFHEHMLFLGTKKYPAEDDYEEFLSQYGGSSNAYTDMEDTNYYFTLTTDAADCQSQPSDALYGALDRFAHFFIAPTFDRDAVDREVKAIDSEYRNGKTNDSWRNFQLLKSLSNQQHPFSNFGCGNYETLMSRGLDTLLDELNSFWNIYYKTYNLRLSVVGHSPLDVLQQAVVDTFGQLEHSTGDHRRIKNNPEQVFPRENAVYGGYDAFSTDGGQLGKLRHVIPLTETRSVKVYFRTPPLEDPVLRRSKPYSVISHLLGHEGPGSLHDVLNEEGYINGLSSGMAVDTADFSLFQISISLTPKGMANKDTVLDLFFQWMAMITSTDGKLMQTYHKEIKQIAEMNFKFRENSDPTDFCSTASELLFQEDIDHSQILKSSSDTTDYDPIVAQSFIQRLQPSNCMITVVSSDYTVDDNSEGDDADKWMTEKWYGAKYREEVITPEQMKQWSTPSTTDSRLRLPELNKYIPTDFSLRCNDTPPMTIMQDETEVSSETLIPPTILTDTSTLRVWHKMDRYWRVPKTYVKASFLSPAIYASPRSMTLNRIYQRMLNDDLNSFVYDASLAGCSYSVSCTPTGYRISVRGYSEKIPFLLETLTSRMLSLIEEMKSNKESLQDKFLKAREALLRETKNYRLDPPYEIASYNARLLIEERVWYLDNYVELMEGVEATRHPLTMVECARAAEECLTGRIKCETLCMGNIDQNQCDEVVTVLNDRFLSQCKALSGAEAFEFRSMKIPTKDEAIAIFGNDVTSRTIPIIYQELAYTETEENNAVEVILQIGSELELGYEGVAVLDLLSHIAYTSAFGQLRTKEQLGYIASAQARRTAGGAWAMSVVVQSSVALPDVLEERCEAWLETFRQELVDMSPESYSQEASSVVAQLLESETKLSQEVDRVWGEILNTEGLSDRIRVPAFDKYLKVAQELFLVQDDDYESQAAGKKTPQQLKDRVIKFFDEHFRIDSPKRRIISSRVYSHDSKDQYEAGVGKPGILSSYSDMRYMKQFLGTYPTIPYWRVENKK